MQHRAIDLSVILTMKAGEKNAILYLRCFVCMLVFSTWVISFLGGVIDVHNYIIPSDSSIIL